MAKPHLSLGNFVVRPTPERFVGSSKASVTWALPEPTSFPDGLSTVLPRPLEGPVAKTHLEGGAWTMLGLRQGPRVPQGLGMVFCPSPSQQAKGSCYGKLPLCGLLASELQLEHHQGYDLSPSYDSFPA